MSRRSLVVALSSGVALLALAASEGSARAEDQAETPKVTEAKSDPKNESSGTLRTTGSVLLVGGGLAFVPALWTTGRVAVGAFEPGGTESAARGFEDPIVFVPLAAGFVAVMVGAALIVSASSPLEKTSFQARSARPLGTFEF